MLPADEDRNLTSEIARGNEQAIELLDKRHRSELERVSRMKGLPMEDAKDVAQETIIGAVKYIQSGQFRGESSLKTLVFAIFRNQIVNFLRRQGRNEAETLFDDSSSENPTALARIEDIAGPLIKPDNKLITEEILRTLPEGHRLILLMNQMWGYTIEEISSMIRRPKGTVGRMLAEAKEMFRQKLL
jgi:RNA polymerase sigma-70 factor (ECF subfamily)